MKKRNLISLVIAIVMIAALFAGCGGTDEPATTTAATSASAATTAATTPAVTTAATTSATTTATEATTEAPKITEGYEFVISTYDSFTYDEGSAIYDEFWSGIEAIEADLGCTISFITGAGGHNNGMGSPLIVALIGGDKYADFIKAHQMNSVPLYFLNGLHTMNSDELLGAGLDLYNEETYNQFFTGLCKINGDILGVDMSGKFVNFDFGHTYVFNKRLVEAAGYSSDQLFQDCFDGNWTYDKFFEIAGKISADLDGDAKNDIWGIVLDADGNEIWSNGVGPIKLTETAATANLDDPQLIKAYEFMRGINAENLMPLLVAKNPSDITPGRGARRTMFYEGKGGFCSLYGGNFGPDTTGTMVDPFGVLPIPKGPDTDHYMMNMVDSECFIMLRTNADYEKAVPIMNALGAFLTSEEDYESMLLENFQGDENSLRVIKELCLPYATLNLCKASDDLYQLTRKQVAHNIYIGEVSAAAVAETYNAQLQSLLDATFKFDNLKLYK